MKRQMIHLQKLLGRKVQDVNGKSAGHIEEFVARRRDGKYVVEEVLLGRRALLERLSVPAVSMLFLHFAGASRRTASHSARWEDLDVSDVRNPKLRISRDELKELK
jgi:hypothetical protein